jgi:hypothetical protein
MNGINHLATFVILAKTLGGSDVALEHFSTPACCLGNEYPKRDNGCGWLLQIKRKLANLCLVEEKSKPILNSTFLENDESAAISNFNPGGRETNVLATPHAGDCLSIKTHPSHKCSDDLVVF